MSQLTKTFKDIVGDGNVLTRELDTAYYRSGFRYGFGGALAVVFPTSLVEQWKVLQAAVQGKPTPLDATHRHHWVTWPRPAHTTATRPSH